MNLLNIIEDDPQEFGVIDSHGGKKVFGGKGYNLIVMARELGLPVPTAFVISTKPSQQIAAYGDTIVPETWMRNEPRVREAVTRMEGQTGKTFGGDPPLLVSVRSGAPVSMPGMMDTILNVGLTDESVEALATMTNEDFAWDSYRRLILMFASTVHGADVSDLAEQADAAREFLCLPEAAMLPADATKEIIDTYRKKLGGYFVPQDVYKQLELAIRAVWSSWNSPRAKTYREVENISAKMGTAVVVQSMVFGNMNDKSGTGVAFTRNPNTGEAVRFGDFLVCAQGEDVVAGTHQTLPLAQLKKVWPKIGKELEKHMVTIEDHFGGDLCDIEFTIEDGKLYMLQTRIGKRAAEANVAITLDRLAAEKIDTDTAREILLKAIADAKDNGGGGGTEVLDDSSMTKLATGLGATPGVVVGHAYFTADSAKDAAESGEDVIMVTYETSPDDVHGMKASVGILTATGGLVSHAAVVARGWGKPCVVGCSEVSVLGTEAVINGKKIMQGDLVKIDGTTGEVFA